jgi:hypothetical protein
LQGELIGPVQQRAGRKKTERRKKKKVHYLPTTPLPKGGEVPSRPAMLEAYKANAHYHHIPMDGTIPIHVRRSLSQQP